MLPTKKEEGDPVLQTNNRKSNKRTKIVARQVGPIRLDLGCGSNKKGPEWIGVDAIQFPGVDVCLNLCEPKHEPLKPGFEWAEKCFERKVIGYTAWPWLDGSIEEFHCAHFIEHLTWPQRIHFFNELWRVLKPGGKGQLILPHWASMRYYGDPTHQSAVAEFAFYYLSRKWRLDEKNAPHTDILHNPKGYSCNFEVVWGHSLHPALAGRNQEYVTHALTFWKDAAQDLIANFTKLVA